MTQAAKLAQLGSPGISTGFKNRIINGAMVIDQRNAGASVTGSTSDPFVTDRWKTPATQNSKLTFQQNAGSVTPPAGFSYYLGATSSSAYSVTSSDIFTIDQRIEGYNCSDLAWGTASAKSVTLSFWVYSSLTGTFGGSLLNSAANRSYVFSYTISAANTWEQKSITIPGDTSGTWLTTTGIGIRLSFSLGSGSTYAGVAGSWSGSTYLSATGATSVVGTSGATFYITGVQLEVGTTATDFEYLDYGRQLIQCQRYYQKSYNTDVSPTTSTPVGCLGAPAYGAGNLGLSLQFCTTMRATPTITVYSQTGSSGVVSQPGGTNVGSSFTVDQPSMRGSLAVLNGSGMTTNSFYYCHYVANAEL